MVLAVLAAAAVLVWPGRGPQLAGLLARTSAGGGTARSTSPGGSWPLAGGPAGTAHRWLLALRGKTPPAGTAGVDELADLVELLVPPLRAGATAAAAVDLATRALGSRSGLAGLLADLGRGARSGGSLAAAWAAAAQGDRSTEVVFLARAWTLSEETGVPLARALDTVARNLRARQSAARALTAATAGARASMALLALLPATGPVIGLLFGLTPVDLYGQSLASRLSLGIGAVLGLAGLLWSRSILQRALRPEVVS